MHLMFKVAKLIIHTTLNSGHNLHRKGYRLLKQQRRL